MMQWVLGAEEYLRRVSSTRIDLGDVVEIIIIAILIYYILAWMQKTRAWALMKGLIVICLFLVFASVFHMDTILWMAQNLFGLAVTALIVVLQPELRKALEELGNKSLWKTIFLFESGKSETVTVSEKTISEIAKACVEMGRVKTGALIVIEQKVSLKEYERTGIDIDGLVTSQLLINIFEHNTPLHDGAVIVRGDRITSATCYLPLSDNLGLSKDLGTRHRAAVGVSEATDSLTIIVSEETGKISAALEGDLKRNLDLESLKAYMRQVLLKETTGGKRILMGRSKTKNGKGSEKESV